jgi:hypothetical protein
MILIQSLTDLSKELLTYRFMQHIYTFLMVITLLCQMETLNIESVEPF